jgi:sulfur carrier protein
MKLIINGQEKEYSSSMTIQQIIDNLDIESKVMAAAVNMNVVKKENWSEYTPQDGDKLEFLEFVGGG